MPKFRSLRKGKRKFRGNQYSKIKTCASANIDLNVPFSEAISDIESSSTVNDSAPNSSKVSVSHAKVIPVDASTPKIKNVPGKPSGRAQPKGNRFMDMENLSEAISVLACPECSNSVEIIQKNKQGISFQFELYCGDCDWSHTFWSSKKRVNRKGYDMNSRIYYAMRSIGKGYKAIVKFLYLMNHPPPMCEKNYRRISENFNSVIKREAKKIMKAACEEVRSIKNKMSSNQIPNPSLPSSSQSVFASTRSKKPTTASAITDIGVSVDGTWQRRGYVSLNGAVAVLSMDTGKVLDIEVMSRFCQGCTNAKVYQIKNPTKYDTLMKKHICRINHKGSAPAMEITGAKRIFERSIEINQLRYTEYFGDGDSKSFPSIENTYAPDIVTKQECIGHVQKRVGTRLRELKKNVKGLGGKGKLTDAVIDKLQNYYGIAIRSNVGDLKGMQSAVLASLFHVASSKDNNYHIHCPTGPNSWCNFNLDRQNGTSEYKPGPGLPMDILVKHIKPIFVSF